jgi:hypothetical protein
MVEAHDSVAVLDDVEADTFVGFCEFAYTGDYRSRMTEREPARLSVVEDVMREHETPLLSLLSSCNNFWGSYPVVGVQLQGDKTRETFEGSV